MKQVLSKNQVNENLDQIKKGVAVCYSINYNRYTNEPTFYIWFREKGIIVVQNKKVYWHSFNESLRGDESATFLFRGVIYTEFITRAGYSYRDARKKKF